MRPFFLCLVFQLASFSVYGQSAYTKTDLNLRTYGSTHSSIIGIIPKGEKVNVQYCTRYWCKVSYKAYYNGFVSKRYLVEQTTPTSYNYKAPSDRPIVLPQPTKRYYTNSFDETVQRPTYYSSPPTGSTALCRDGTYSFSRNRRGTCSHHGGVSKWLSNTTSSYSNTSYSSTYRHTSSTSVRCSGITQKGYRCKRRTRSGSGYCWQH